MPPAPSRSTGRERERIVLGRIAGPFGLQGWVKVASFTEPAEQILEFPLWRTASPGGDGPALRPLEGRPQGRWLIVRLADVGDRNAAAAIGKPEIWVERSALPALGRNEFYRADLLGLEVEDTRGRPLGRVDHFLDLPANAVMVVVGEREHWVPLVPGRLRRVDLERGRVVVDWDPDF